MTNLALRRVLHAASAGVLALALVSWGTLRAGLAGLVVVGVVVETGRLRHAGMRRWLARRLPVFRPAEAHRPSGGLWLVIGFAVAAWFPPNAAAAGLLTGALADPAAAMAGARWGGQGRKTWVGSTAAALVGIAAVAAVGAAWPAAVMAGVIGALIERFSGPVDDNLVVAPGVAGAVWVLA